jgi:hypothetical protein
MEVLAVHQMLLEEEERLQLHRHKLDGWCIWPLFRSDAPWQDAAVGAEGAQMNNFPSRRQHFGLAFRDLLTLGLGRFSQSTVLCTSSGYLLDEDEHGRPKDWLFDEICRLVPGAIKIEMVTDLHLYSKGRSSAFPSQLTNSLAHLVDVSLISRVPIPKDIFAVADALARDLYEIPHLRHLTTKAIARRLIAFRRVKAVWRFVLGALNAKILFLDNGYYAHAAIAAAKERGIGVIEMQHGSFHERSFQYHWPSFPAAESGSLPQADLILLFGEFWRELMAKDPYWSSRARVVGNHRVDRHRQIRKGRVRQSGHTLVVTTQGRSQVEVCQWVANLLKYVPDWNDLTVFIKLHPARDMTRQSYLEMLPADERLKVLAGSERPSTLELLTYADFHTSIYSTCHYEAVALGLKTYVLPFEHSDFMTPMINRGHAYAPRTPAEMADMMRRSETVSSDESCASYYYECDGRKNIQRAIAEFNAERQAR